VWFAIATKSKIAKSNLAAGRVATLVGAVHNRSTVFASWRQYARPSYTIHWVHALTSRYDIWIKSAVFFRNSQSLPTDGQTNRQNEHGTSSAPKGRLRYVQRDLKMEI